jgi:hypothetical protein
MMQTRQRVALVLLILLFVAPLLFGIGAVTVESFVYKGLDDDKVGSGGNTRADGVQDAHFVLTLKLSSPAQVKSLKLQLTDKQGNLLDAYYQSKDYGFAWILGVYQGRQMLNPIPANNLGVQIGTVTFDLYAHDSGVFQEGASFRLDIETSQGNTRTSITLGEEREVEKPGATVQKVYSVALIDRVLFRGFDADKVGSWATTKADGSQDAHFTAVLQLPPSTEIQSMVLTHTDALGNSLGSFWNSRDYGSAWILGAYINGVFINPTPGSSHGRYSGDVVVELYAQDNGGFQKHEYFVLDIVTDKARMRSHFILLDPDSSPARASTPPSVPSQPSISSLRWVGFDADKVGYWDQVTADGSRDGHFVLTLSVPPNSTIDYLSLHLAHPNGTRYPSYWYTDSTYSWVLGAYLHGNLLNAGRQKPLARSLSGTVVFDLYVASDGSMVSGTYYLLDVSINGKIYTTSVTI